jgi:hypothetical protein
MSENTLHRCDEFCVCPVDGAQLLYAPDSGEHACQRADCAHAHGITRDALAWYWYLRRKTARS